MDEHSDLVEQCARLAGIEAQYIDAFGNHFLTPTATRAAILDALGFPARTSDEMRDSVERLRGLRQGLVDLLVVVEALHEGRIALRPTAAGANATWRLILEDGTILERRSAVASDGAITLPSLPAGYHRLSIEADGKNGQATVIAAPRRCFEPEAIAQGGREWGLSTQVYGFRSDRNLGIGDYTDIASVARRVGAIGASFVGLSPLHALFPGDRQKYSPYSPSSRLFLESIYIDLQAIEGFSISRAARLLEAPETAARVAALKEGALVDYAGVWAVKRPILEALWKEHGAAEIPAFDRFWREQGERLTSHATFDALSEYFWNQGKTWLGDWPEAFQRPSSEAVVRFREANRERVAFYAWLQWLADDQLAKAARRARSAGMHIGLYRDLAVGSDRGGSEVWANQDAYAPSLSVGAPPDPLAPQGQNWGLPALNPIALAKSGLAGFRAPIRANMRHAGAIRIDHAFQLRRLFLVPGAEKATAGAYVDYPFAAMLAVLRIESHRARCLVIAEDLGTAPPHFSETINESGIYGYRVVPFERDGDGSFRRGSRYAHRAVAVSGTHDLPTFIGWWRGTDIDLRNSLGVFDLDQAAAMREERRRELKQFSEALAAEGLVEPSSDTPREPPLEAATAFLGHTNCALACLQIEDAIGEVNQANLPGIVDGHPNWRRRLSFDLDRIFAPGSEVNRLAAVLAAEGRDVRRRGSALAGPPPRATYRLQFRKEFGFDDATAIVPYLARLGVSHVYASPISLAQPGSPHGYDVADHARVNPELGGEEAFYRFSDTLRAHGMGLVLDIVPNHMGVGGDRNPSWLLVLEWGRASPAAAIFDIDWDKGDAGGKLVVPFLAHRYGVALERGELKLVFDKASGGIDVWHFTHRFPICPIDYPDILERAIAAAHGAPEPAQRGLTTISERLRSMHSRTPEVLEECELLKLQLRVLTETSIEIAAALGGTIELINGSSLHTDSFGVLHRILEKQAYRLAHWRVASSDINYRRFFDINTLAGVRQEDPAVFEKTHAGTFKLVREGRVAGLRIDHVDGLADPQGYLRNLQGAIGPAFYIVVEKILEPGERLPHWPIAGTSGYEVLNLIDGIFVDESSASAFQKLYELQLGVPVDYARDLRAAKEEILHSAFSSELESLVGKLKTIAEGHPTTRDFSRNALRRALTSMISFFPVYRTYGTDEGASVEDVQLIDDTATRVKKTGARTYPAVLDFVTSLLAENPPATVSVERHVAQSFRRMFQQLTGPVMAKSLEDTHFYRYARLIVLNEVGGDPHEFGHSVADFHAANLERQRDWPNSMIATATHDTKRGEDARARLVALSEIPEEWAKLVEAWHRATVKYRAVGAPDSNDCYMLLQAIVGAWPVELLGDATGDTGGFVERLEEFVVKALRESKRVTSWLDPDARYEDAAGSLVREALDPKGGFLPVALPFVRRIAFLGMLNALTRTALKYTLPGVPDTYQGTEFWDLSLVDPDNRRPVDYRSRAAALAAPQQLEELVRDWRKGALKLLLTARLLADRAANPAFYANAGYAAIEPTGEHQRRLVAFRREQDHAAVVTVAGRLLAPLAQAESWPLGDVWDDTAIAIPRGHWRDVITGAEHDFRGGPVRVAELFSGLPLSVLRTAV